MYVFEKIPPCLFTTIFLKYLWLVYLVKDFDLKIVRNKLKNWKSYLHFCSWFLFAWYTHLCACNNNMMTSICLQRSNLFLMTKEMWQMFVTKTICSWRILSYCEGREKKFRECSCSTQRIRHRKICFTWHLPHLLEVMIVAFIFLGALMFILARKKGGTNVIFCVEFVANQFKQIWYLNLNMNHVSVQVDKGWYFAFNVEKWIIVVALGIINSWASSIGENWGLAIACYGDFETLANWKVNGALFLSLDQQLELGYQINVYLPFNSYLQKNVGYLFVIQHGAMKIYDVDEKATILGHLGHVFNIEFCGPNS